MYALTDPADLDFLDVVDVQVKAQAADEALAGLAREVDVTKAFMRSASEQVATRRRKTLLRQEQAVAAATSSLAGYSKQAPGDSEGPSSKWRGKAPFPLGEGDGDREGGATSLLFSSPHWPPRSLGGIFILFVVMSFLIWEERTHCRRARKITVELKGTRESAAKVNRIVSSLRQELSAARDETELRMCRIRAEKEALGREVGSVCGEWVVGFVCGVVCCFS